MNPTRDNRPSFLDRLSLLDRLVAYSVLIVGAVLMVLPFVWMVSTACKPSSELNRLPLRWIPEEPTCLENVRSLNETSPDFDQYLRNSIILTVGRTVGQFITCSLAAYGFARFEFPGKRVLFAASLALLMVPFQAIVVQEYLLLRRLDWLYTFAALIIPGIFSAFALFLLRQAFLQIPIELEEAAMMDGANPLQVLWSVTLPLSLPALAAFAVITVQAAWNDFLFPVIVSNSAATRPLTVGIALLQGERSTPWNLLMMGSLLATLPMLILFILLQRYFIEGVALTGSRR
ncbi:MAG: carbohydrate ABC transporter permease [bacterium]|nr:carbohydrate ABC transporter permease [bacterium]